MVIINHPEKALQAGLVGWGRILGDGFHSFVHGLNAFLADVVAKEVEFRDAELPLVNIGDQAMLAEESETLL